MTDHCDHCKTTPAPTSCSGLLFRGPRPSQVSQMSALQGDPGAPGSLPTGGDRQRPSGRTFFLVDLPIRRHTMLQSCSWVSPNDWNSSDAFVCCRSTGRYTMHVATHRVAEIASAVARVTESKTKALCPWDGGRSAWPNGMGWMTNGWVPVLSESVEDFVVLITQSRRDK